MQLPWKRLIRFVATDGRGELIMPSEDFDLGNVTEADGLKAKFIAGDDVFDTTGKTEVTDETATVKKQAANGRYQKSRRALQRPCPLENAVFKHSPKVVLNHHQMGF